MPIMKEYAQLTESLRYKFFALNQSGMSQTKIAIMVLIFINWPSIGDERLQECIFVVNNKPHHRRKNHLFCFFY